jgi:uncharacterized protein (TIGR02246 family)
MRIALPVTAILLTIGLFIGCSSRQPGAKTQDEVTDLAQRYAKAWSSKDPDAPAKFFSETGSLKVNNNRPAVGRKDIAEVARRFMTAFPDMVVSMDKVVTKGEITEFHWTLDGHNTGPRGTGNRVRISGYEEWRVDSAGLITESKGHFDEAEYDRQIKHGVK